MSVQKTEQLSKKPNRKRSNKKINSQLRKIILSSIGVLDIFTSNYAIRIHGREVSKLLKENQRTISNKLIILEEQNILKSAIKGSVKEYYLNMDNTLVHDLLVISEEKKSINFLMRNFLFLDLFKQLREKVGCNILIFGSYARGDFSKDSDMDMLILGDYNKEKLEKIMSLYPIKVHVVCMAKKTFEKGLFKKENFMIEVLRNHIILKGTSDLVDVFWRFYHG